MDGLKLDKWKKNFNEEIRNIKIEFDAFFFNRQLEEYYSLQEDETSNELALQIDDKLPKEIKERLSNALLKTKPEDSI